MERAFCGDSFQIGRISLSSKIFAASVESMGPNSTFGPRTSFLADGKDDAEQRWASSSLHCESFLEIFEKVQSECKMWLSVMKVHKQWFWRNVIKNKFFNFSLENLGGFGVGDKLLSKVRVHISGMSKNIWNN